MIEHICPACETDEQRLVHAMSQAACDAVEEVAAQWAAAHPGQKVRASQLINALADVTVDVIDQLAVDPEQRVRALLSCEKFFRDQRGS